jgi:predicted ABC-type ATPase
LKTYTVIGGINGVGKSSLTGVLMGERTDLGKIINVDDMAKNMNNDNTKAGQFAISKIRKYLSKGISFTQETTLAGKDILKTVKQASELNY